MDTENPKEPAYPQPLEQASNTYDYLGIHCPTEQKDGHMNFINLSFQWYRRTKKIKMKKLLISLCSMAIATGILHAQSVGIGTTNPNAGSILDLGASGKPLILPRLTTPQMNAVSPLAQGMIIYNTTEHQLYSYMRYRSSIILGQSTSRWQPITTGPAMIAWGVVDSFGAVKSGSGNFSVFWDEDERWYTLTTTSHPYYKDTMLLMINPVGNGSWDQAVATGELIEGSTRRATIKFTDVSRIASGWTLESSRRRSWFHFVLYNLRKDPY